MKIKKAFYLLSCATIIGTSFVSFAVNDVKSINVQASKKNKISAKTYYSDVNAIKTAIYKSNLSSKFGLENMNKMNNKGLTFYTDKDYSYDNLITAIKEIDLDGENREESLNYLLDHFSNRFDSQTKETLSKDISKSFNWSNPLCNDFQFALKQWSEKYSGVAPTKHKLNIAKNKVKNAQKDYHKAMLNYKKNHSKKSKKNLENTKNKLTIAKYKYKALAE